MTIGFIPNLHVILLGDEFRAGEYLPYGKQLVRQLMAVGGYGGKRVVSPEDGLLVEAWMSGEHRWVRITAVGCKAIFMDSGVVDVHNLGWDSPALTRQDGTLFYSRNIKAYSSQNKLLGEIKPPAISATPTPTDGVTKAFAAETKLIDGVLTRDSDSETLLAGKKFITSRIPPSLFTGKLRLYVQAHYGKRLTEWGKLSANLDNQPPSLTLTLPVAGGDQYQFSLHSSHTGIYTDADKRHWLVQIGFKGAAASSGKLNVFKMNVPACIEPLRAKLLDSSTLSSADKERVEAYILSQSYPDYDFCISKDITIPLNSSMGYGWHFNWSGTAADIVQVDTISTGGMTYKHRSTHWRINISRKAEYVDDGSNTALQNEARRWVVGLQTVETQDWKNTKWQHVITYPDWAEYKLAVFGTLWGTSFGSGAPIYVFYTRDELKVVRYSKSGGAGHVTYELASSPIHYMGELTRSETVISGSPCYGHVQVGPGSSYARSKTFPTDPTTSTFSCGNVTASGVEDGYSYAEYRLSCGAPSHTQGTYYDTLIYGGQFSVNPVTIETGNFGCYVTHTAALTGMYPAPTTYYLGVPSGQATTSTIYGGHSDDVKLAIVIPFGDAEAVYVWGAKWETEVYSGNEATYASNGGQSSTFVNGAALIVDQKVVGYGDALSSNQVSDTTVVVIPLASSLICNKGTLPFEPVGISGAFFQGEPATHIEQSFYTRSSAGIDADVTGSGVTITGGYKVAGTFVGWA